MNIQQMTQIIQQYSSNPQALFKRFGIPEQLNTPQDVAQYLMNNGRVTQDQVNQANSMYRQLFNR
ncbi:MAG TPA: hypothetical protein DHV37_05850 [Erysipelotrichaceae bacterium]|jgi:hypothetical protein|nr:hypothetical protein [Erysipelotrichaceae bacterium]